MSDRWSKDPDEVLSYKFDWAPSTNGSGDSDWLASGETISSTTITATSGITVDSSSITDANTTVTVTLSGGTAGSVYLITCEIVTSEGQTAQRTARLTVTNN